MPGTISIWASTRRCRHIDTLSQLGDIRDTKQLITYYCGKKYEEQAKAYESIDTAAAAYQVAINNTLAVSEYNSIALFRDSSTLSAECERKYEEALAKLPDDHFYASISDEYRSGRIVVKKEDKGKEGCINEYGELVIPCEYRSIDFNDEGLAFAHNGSEWGYCIIDLNGELIFPKPSDYYKITDVYAFVNGIACIRIKGGEDNSVYIYIDTRGNKIGDSYTSCSDFNEAGRALV